MDCSVASIFLILLLILISVCTKGNAFVAMCGKLPPTPFNKSTHMCCNYNIVPRIINGSEQRCCGDKESPQVVYQYPRQKCCGIQVRNVTEIESGEYECCGNVFIWRDGDEFCCANRRYTPREFKKRSDTKCCGQTPYNNDDQLCCKGSVRWRINPNIDCCGNGTYDKNKEDCDGVKIVPKLKENFETCAGIAYDPNVSVCCKRNIVKMPKGYNATVRPTCCGSTVIRDEKNEDCSRSRVVPKGHISCNSGSVNPDTDLCCDDVPYFNAASTSLCCGKKKITKIQKCCNERTGLAYDPNNNQCCGGEVVPKSVYCCDGKKYNEKHQLCCQRRSGGLQIVNKTNTRQSHCCNLQPYDLVTQECVAGIVKPRNDTGLVCSGVKAANINMDSCCYKTPYDSEKLSCCGKITYNHDTQGCYGGEVKSKYVPTVPTVQLGDSPNQSVTPSLSVTPNPTVRRIGRAISCEPSSKWTELSQLKINCTDSHVFIIRKNTRAKQKAKKTRSNKMNRYKIRKIFVGDKIKRRKWLKLTGKCNKIRKARSFIVVKNNMTSPKFSVSFVKNNRRNRNLAAHICKPAGKS